jgi:anti-anti-sigma factor
VHKIFSLPADFSKFRPKPRRYSLRLKNPLTGQGQIKMAISGYSQGVILVELPPEPNIRAELDKLREILQSKQANVVIDFSTVDIMTSLTLSGFLKVRELLNEAEKRLIFVNVSPITKDIFAVTCFDGVFEFADDKEQALALLAQNCECPQPAK